MINFNLASISVNKAWNCVMLCMSEQQFNILQLKYWHNRVAVFSILKCPCVDEIECVVNLQICKWLLSLLCCHFKGVCFTSPISQDGGQNVNKRCYIERLRSLNVAQAFSTFCMSHSLISFKTRGGLLLSEHGEQEEEEEEEEEEEDCYLMKPGVELSTIPLYRCRKLTWY